MSSLGLRGILALVFAVSFPAPVLHADVTDLQVPANVEWFDTGLDILADSRVTIIASNWVIYGVPREMISNADGLSPLTDGKHAAGPGHLCDSAPSLSLVGKIGGTTEVGTGTPLPQMSSLRGAGCVGTSYTAVMNTGGRLFLGFNDQTTAFSDNSGHFQVRVIRGDYQVAPATATAAVEVHWPSSLNRIYVVQSSTDLTAGSWQDSSLLFWGNGADLSIVEPTRSQPRKFFRIIEITNSSWESVPSLSSSTKSAAED